MIFFMTDVIKNKNLQVGDKIIFILAGKMTDGTIIEKNNMGKGDIDFLIQTERGLVKTKHRKLDLYHIVGELNSQLA
jgi:hypothetical protein